MVVSEGHRMDRASVCLRRLVGLLRQYHYDECNDCVVCALSSANLASMQWPTVAIFIRLPASDTT
jgi:hypothetical protein